MTHETTQRIADKLRQRDRDWETRLATAADGITAILETRAQLHAELTSSSNPDPQWWRDRIDAMAHLNRQLDRRGYFSGRVVGA